MIGINHVANTLRDTSWWKAKGPVLCGQVYSERHGQDMLQIKYKVANGTYIDEATVPFGYFVYVQDFNRVESELTILVTAFDDGGDPASPLFKTRCKSIKNLNQYICSATECRQIVPTGTSPDSGAMVWESYVDEIDDKHAEKVTVTAVSLNLVEDCGWDDVLNEDVHFTEELVTTKPADCGWASVVSELWVGSDEWVGSEAWALDTGTFTSYEEVRCNWWLKKVEVLHLGVKQSYWETRNYYWPPVLEQMGFLPYDFVLSEEEEEAGKTPAAKWIVDIRLKEAYNGPCRTHVMVGLGAGPGDVTPTQMLTDACRYDGLQVQWSIPACLHGSIVDGGMFNTDEIIGTDHPIYVMGSVTMNFPATTYTDWPSRVMAEVDPRPYKGQYLTRIVNIYSPA